MYAQDDDGIPTGELVPLGPHPWDDCFTELGDQPAVLHWPDALTVTLETACRCVVVFDQPQHAICVEPQSDPPDAFNLGPTAVRPGEPLVATATWSWRVEAG
jgi:galactose mutarotase-like enzyme